LLGCPFELECRKLGDGAWTLKVANPNHNHDAWDDPLCHPINKQLTAEDKELIRSMTLTGSRAREILAQLGRTDIDLRTVYNARAHLLYQRLDGRTPMETLISELEDDRYTYSITTDANGRTTNFFFARDTSMKWYRAYPYVLLLDSTYKTNK
jgi:hypothetical protein